MRLAKTSVILLGLMVMGLPVHAGKLKSGKWMKVIDRGGNRNQLKGEIFCIHGSLKEAIEDFGEEQVTKQLAESGYEVRFLLELDGETYYGNSVPYQGDISTHIFHESWLEELSQEEKCRIKQQAGLEGPVPTFSK